MQTFNISCKNRRSFLKNVIPGVAALVLDDVQWDIIK
ncbi:hypothetical protein QFZ28_005777 [Neobacillus niacini]|nr:hypothetical protein [Neobacillus niacini]